MASRRQAIGEAISSASSGIVDLYIKQLFAQKQMEENDRLLRARQAEDDARQAEEARRAEAARAALAQEQFQMGLANGPNANPWALSGVESVGGIPTQSFIPSQSKIASPFYEDLDKVTSLAALPGESSLRARFQGAHGDTDETASSALPGFPVAKAIPPELARLMAARAEKEKLLRSQLPREKVDFFDRPGATTPTSMFMTEEEQGKLGPFSSSIDPQGEIAKFNQISAGTRGAKASDAFSASNASNRGQMTPELMAARIEESNAKARGAAQASAAHGQPTDRELQNGQIATQLAQSDFLASELEKKGARIGIMSQLQSSSPAGSLLVDNIGNAFNAFKVSDEDRLYQQYANDFTNLRGFQLSGVTVRADERATFMSTYFGMQGDSPSQVQAKALARKTLVLAAQASLGRGAQAGGEVMGQAIAAGRIPISILEQLDIQNPAFRAGLERYIPVLPVK